MQTQPSGNCVTAYMLVLYSKRHAECVDSTSQFSCYTAFAYVAQGMFERHKLIAATQLCMGVLRARGELQRAKFDYLLSGPKVCAPWAQPACFRRSERLWHYLAGVLRVLHDVHLTYTCHGQPWQAVGTLLRLLQQSPHSLWRRWLVLVRSTRARTHRHTPMPTWVCTSCQAAPWNNSGWMLPHTASGLRDNPWKRTER